MERKCSCAGPGSIHAAGRLLLGMALLAACSSLPSLEEQTALIARGEWRLRQIGSQAVRIEWGKPDYSLLQRIQFYPLTSGNWVPDFRVRLGEVPKNWDLTTVFGDGLFLAYAERGELLGFHEDRLVYREHLSSDQIHAIGKQWQRESLFKTRLEGGGSNR